MARILLVEDDPKALLIIETALESRQHVVDAVTEGVVALEHILYHPYDMAILDWVLPDISGLQICQKYRENGGEMPILFLTGQTDVPDRVTALDSGADDYLCKPFSSEELLARVAALLRRPREEDENLVEVGDVVLDLEKGIVTVANERVELTSSEFVLLKLLMTNPGRIYSSNELLLKFDSDYTTDAIKQLVMRLRRKIDRDGMVSCIVTVRGKGYQFDCKK